jgi:predicted phage tail protein
MQTVYLNGGIAQFGEKWTTNCKDISSIFKLIECQTPGFKKYLTDAVEADVGFEIQRGSEFLENPEELLLSLNNEDIIITEVPSGSKSGGAKILAAIAIMLVAPHVGAALAQSGGGAAATAAAASGTGYANAAVYAGVMKTATAVAINLAIQGVTQLLAPGPETEPDKNDSYLFSGASNNGKQGLPVPILYGELIVGGIPISSFYSNSPFRAAFNSYEALGGAPGTEGIVYQDNSGNNIVWIEAYNDFVNLSDVDAIYS